ncbi:MAG: B12-binding domain-containing radical SAM protein [Pyrinomonadaceae bacterium]
MHGKHSGSEWTRSDVLLINPPWVSKDENIWNGIKAAMPPLSLLSIAAYLEQNGISVQILDVHIEKLTAEQVKERIRVADPRWVGMTVMTATSVPAHKIARLVKEAVPSAKVVMGGVHAEALPGESLSNSAVDYVVRGDGEQTFFKMISGHDPTLLDGVSWRDGDVAVNNPPVELNMSLDDYPMPAYHLVPMHKYYPTIGSYRRLPAINMLMTRGCPGKCTFCNSANTTLRSRSAERVVEEIEYLRNKFGIREIQFYDDTFTVNRKNVMRFCELMIERKVNVSWVAFIRADCFNDELAAAMKKAGCHQVLIGVESGDDEILKNIRKTISHDRTKKSIAIARKYGIESRCAFIFGNMGDTIETMQRTLDYSIELDPDLGLYNISTPYPGTQLFQWAKDNGYLVTEEWSEYELSRFLLKLPTVTEDEVFQFYADAHKKFYTRPIALYRRIKRFRRWTHIRDAVHAFFFIVLRHKMGRRGEVREDWVSNTKADFFDLDLLDGSAVPKLTYELRQPKTVDPRAYGSAAYAAERA